MAAARMFRLPLLGRRPAPAATPHGDAPAPPAWRAVRVGSHGGCAIGAPAAAFALPGVHGETQTLDALRAGGRPVLLLFVDPANRGNRALLREVGELVRRRGSAVAVAAIVGDIPPGDRIASEFGTIPLLADADGGVGDAYGVTATPAAVLVGDDGSIGSSVAVGSGTIRRLVDLAAAIPWRLPAPGAPALETSVSGDGADCLDACHRRGGGSACLVVCRAEEAGPDPNAAD